MNAYQQHRFLHNMENAKKSMILILDNTRQPRLPAETAHTYLDKFLVAEFTTFSACAATLVALESLQLSVEQLAQLRDWSRERSVTLRFQSEEHCVFLDKKEKTRTSGTSLDTELTTASRIRRLTSRLVTKWTEFSFRFTVDYRLVAFPGADVDAAIVLQEGTRSCTITQSSENPPLPEHVVVPPRDIQLTWLLQHVGSDLEIQFAIDREHDQCKTPRRNSQVNAAFAFFTQLHTWCTGVHSYISHVGTWDESASFLAPEKLLVADILVPLLPFFEEREEGAPRPQVPEAAPLITSVLPSEEAQHSMLPSSDEVQLFLQEQKKSLDQVHASQKKMFSGTRGVLTLTEFWLATVMHHLKAIVQAFADGVNYVEDMLRQQLTAAIGKEIGSEEFSEYMAYHLRKLMKEEYAPKMLSFSVRRPQHHPEGAVSIENSPSDGQMSKPVLSMQRLVLSAEQGRPLELSLNATTRVQLRANRHVHGWIRQRFDGDHEAQNTRIIARARQFSSFVLMIGTMSGSDEFIPREAILLANKDEALLQLLCEELPTAQVFKKSIESLSPEQRAFAKAFRAMQLQSTLFALCIVQVKPALEAVLNLPDDSLTKEIKLSQRLMSHLVTYQIPSDQLSSDIDGPAKDEDEEADKPPNEPESVEQEQRRLAERTQKVERVRHLAQEMEDMLEESKQEELRDAALVAQYNKAEKQGQIQDLIHSFGSSWKSERKSSIKCDADFMAEGGGGGAPGGGEFNFFMSSAAGGRDQALGGMVENSLGELDCLLDDLVADGNAEKPQASKDEPEGEDDEPSEEKKPAKKSKAFDETDVTTFPVELNSKLEALDLDAAVHSTILKCGPTWSKSEQKGLLSSPVKREVDMEAAQVEKNKAFDLLDALSRSGGIALCAADLHVIIAGTHTFTRSLIDYVVQENSNPIEKLERSALILGSVIHGVPAEELVKPEHLPKLRVGASAHLFAAPVEEN